MARTASLALLFVTAVANTDSRADMWSWLAPEPQGNQLGSAAYSPEADRVVAAGFGANLVTKAGANGVWTSTSLPTTAVTDIVWTGRDFVAVGQGWIGHSVDGLVWTTVPRVDPRPLYTAVAHGNGTVAVLRYNEILLSKDPLRVKWLKRKLPVGRDSYGRRLIMNDLAYGRGLFVSVGEDGAIITSPDGAKWTTRTRRTEETLEEVAFNGTFFIAAGENALLRSPDGINWSIMPSPELEYESSHVSYRIFTAGNELFLADRYGNPGLYRYNASGTTWTREPSDDTGWIRGGCTDGANGAYFFGLGGRVARLSAGATAPQPEIDPVGTGRLTSYQLQYFAGYLRDNFFRADYTGSTENGRPVMSSHYYDKDKKRWEPFRDSLPDGVFFEPDSFHQTGAGVVAAAPDGLYLYQNNDWSKLGPRPGGDPSSRLLCLTRAASGRIVAVCDEVGAYRVYFSDDWQTWGVAPFPGELPQDFPMVEKISHDGRRFILLAERGNLFVSETGEAWTRLPTLPDDPPELLAAYDLQDRPRGNHIMNFAAGGDRIVATAGKWSRNDGDGYQRWEIEFSEVFLRFYVYPLPGTDNHWSWVFAPGSGGRVDSWTWSGGTPGERSVHMNSQTPILWTGRSYLSVPHGSDEYSLDTALASGGGVYTSEDGFDWKLRDLPAYGLTTATWTGSRVAVLAEEGPILTHPTGLPPEIGTKSQTIKFRLPKKLYVGRSYMVRPLAQSKLPVNLVVADPDTASLSLRRKGRRWAIVLDILKPGNNTVTAYQSGDHTWKAAVPVAVAFEALPTR